MTGLRPRHPAVSVCDELGHIGKHLFVVIIEFCIVIMALPDGSSITSRRTLNPLLIPRIIRLVHNAARQVRHGLLADIQLGVMLQQRRNKGLQLLLVHAQVVLQHGHAFGAHREVGVKAFQRLPIEIRVAAFPDLTVEGCAAVFAEEVTLLADGLREPVAEEREHHPHVDVVGVAHATGVGQSLALHHAGVVTQDANLNGLFHDVEIVVLALTDLQHLRTERIAVRLRQPIPLTDEVDQGFFEDRRRAHAGGEVRPRDGVGRDGAEKNLALAKQRDVDRLGDDADGAHGLGDVDQADAVVQHGGDVGVVEDGLLVVEGAEEVVVVLVDLRHHFAVLDVEKEADVTGGTPVGIHVLSTTAGSSAPALHASALQLDPWRNLLFSRSGPVRCR